MTTYDKTNLKHTGAVIFLRIHVVNAQYSWVPNQKLWLHLLPLPGSIARIHDQSFFQLLPWVWCWSTTKFPCLIPHVLNLAKQSPLLSLRYPNMYPYCILIFLDQQSALSPSIPMYYRFGWLEIRWSLDLWIFGQNPHRWLVCLTGTPCLYYQIPDQELFLNVLALEL